LRVVYYARPSFFDPALSFIREMSKRVELHLILELSPESWNSALFDVPPMKLPSGIMPADPVLANCFPEGVRQYWQRCASFNLVIHDCPRALHPATWQMSRKAVQFIRELKPDVLHLDDVSLRLVLSIQGLGKMPIVLTLHDPEPHSGENNWRTGLKNRLVFRRTGQFVLHNRALQEAFCARHRLGSDMVSSVPLGVFDIHREWSGAEPVKEEELTVLFFGRLSPYKGLEVLYEAASRVALAIPNVRFVIAGRPIPNYVPPDPPSLPNGASVEVIERHISNAERTQLFQRAAIVACPYTDATQSGVVLTAYAFDKPVVATQVGGLPEYVLDGVTGKLVPPRNSEALAEAITLLLQDHSLRRQMALNIGSRNGLTSWESMAEDVEKIYRKATTRERDGQ
jgi:glycosyltransferase involved in cell wall biosynthesis